MPSRFVTLMNPRPRRRFRFRSRSGRFTRRRTIRRRRVHRNPSARRRTMAVARVKHHSPAMRRKIGLAVKRAMAARRSGGGGRVTRIISRFHPRRRSARRSFGGGSLVSGFRQALGRPMLMKAGGAVAATFGTGWILRNYGAKLPMANDKYGRIIYLLGIPIAAAYLVRRQNRDLAEGMVIGGLVMSINTLMQGFRAPTPAPAAVGSYGVAGELGQPTFGYYPQGIDDGAGLGGSNVAFSNSAWS